MAAESENSDLSKVLAGVSSESSDALSVSSETVDEILAKLKEVLDKRALSLAQSDIGNSRAIKLSGSIVIQLQAADEEEPHDIACRAVGETDIAGLANA